MLQIDDADEFVAAEHGDGEEGFEAVFGQFVEGLKARVFEGVTGDGDRTFVFGHPTGDSAADLELQAIDNFVTTTLQKLKTNGCGAPSIMGAGGGG